MEEAGGAAAVLESEVSQLKLRMEQAVADLKLLKDNGVSQDTRRAAESLVRSLSDELKASKSRLRALKKQQNKRGSRHSGSAEVDESAPVHCCNCGIERTDKYRHRRSSDLCPSCVAECDRDLVEILFLDHGGAEQEGGGPPQLRRERITKSDRAKAEARFKALGGADVVLDLHKVLDTISPTTPLWFPVEGSSGTTASSENPITRLRVVCCSYIGRRSYSMRAAAVEDLHKRLLVGQISWAALVFTRDRNDYAFHRAGSKAWFCAAVGARYFLDDAQDHIASVASINQSPQTPINAFRVVGAPSSNGRGGGQDTILAILNHRVVPIELELCAAASSHASRPTPSKAVDDKSLQCPSCQQFFVPREKHVHHANKGGRHKHHQANQRARSRPPNDPLCHACFKACRNHLIEFVFLDSRTGTLKRQLVSKGRSGEAQAMEIFKQLGTADVVLDLHGVLDTVPPSIPLFAAAPATGAAGVSSSSACGAAKVESPHLALRFACCSYVGAFSHALREAAVEEIAARLRSGQLQWGGALVFARNRDCQTFHEPGSKAWFCAAVQARYFLDDAEDHIASVASMPLISRPNGPPVSTFRVVGRPSPDGSGGGDSTILAILNTHVRAAELGAQKSAGVPGSGFGGEGKQAATVHAVADARLQARHVQLPMVGHCVNDGRPVRVVALSDTHNLQKAVGGQPGVVVPDGDVLVHCGDFTNSGSRQEVQAFVDWFSSLPHPVKLVVAGNHESGPFVEFQPKHLKGGRSTIRYLRNQAVEVGGVVFFGIPWKQQFKAKALFDQSNLPVDVLIAHEPPKGILDSGHGCDTLREICLGTAASQKFATDTADAVMSDVFAAEECGDTPTKSGAGGPAANPDFSPTADHKHPKPRVVLFGHIHECAGVETVANTTFINCAVANDGMRAHKWQRPVVVFDIQPVAGASKPQNVRGNHLASTL